MGMSSTKLDAHDSSKIRVQLRNLVVTSMGLTDWTLGTKLSSSLFHMTTSLYPTVLKNLSMIGLQDSAALGLRRCRPALNDGLLLPPQSWCHHLRLLF
jgi:hypothetical protein